MNTGDQKDLAFLRDLVADQPQYHIAGNGTTGFSWFWRDHYSDLIPGQLYIKIDDDIVFIQVCNCHASGSLYRARYGVESRNSEMC